MSDQPFKFASLGMSCQTAYQLSRFAETYPNLAQFCKGPFDWLICPMESAARWLQEGLPTPERQELTVRNTRVFWPRMGLWFWHGFEKKAGDRNFIDIDATYDRERDKFLHLRQRLRKQISRKTIFVASNVQSNLDEVFAGTSSGVPQFSGAGQRLLQQAISRFSGRTIPVQPVCRRDRTASDLAPVWMQPHASVWKGSDSDWDRVLFRLLDKHAKVSRIKD